MNHSLKSGIIFTAIGKFSMIITNLIVSAILSRLLSPDEYGVIAIVQVFILFFQMLVEAGIGPAIIQNKKLTNRDIGVLFNYSAILAIILSLIFGFFGQILVYIYDNVIYIKIAWIQSIAIFISGLNVIPVALLNKEKRFKKININQIIASLISGIVGVTLACFNYGVYALIFSSITLAVVFFIMNILSVNIHYQKSLDYKVLKKILMFSIHQFSFNFVNYFSRNLDNILIGKYMGPVELGNYSKAYQLLMMPNSILSGIINPVLQPILSDYQDNVDKIREQYINIVRFLSLIGCSLSVFLSLNAKDIIYFMFGTQWTAAIFPFQILSLTVWIQMTLSSTGAIFQSRNKSKELFITGFYSAIILVGSIIIGIISGDLNKFAIILTIGFFINYIVSFSRVMSLALDANLISLFIAIKIPVFIGFIIFLILILFYKLTDFHYGSFINLIISGIVFIVSFIILCFITGELKILRSMFK